MLSCLLQYWITCFTIIFTTLLHWIVSYILIWFSNHKSILALFSTLTEDLKKRATSRDERNNSMKEVDVYVPFLHFHQMCICCESLCNVSLSLGKSLSIKFSHRQVQLDIKLTSATSSIATTTATTMPKLTLLTLPSEIRLQTCITWTRSDPCLLLSASHA